MEFEQAHRAECTIAMLCEPSKLSADTRKYQGLVELLVREVPKHTIHNMAICGETADLFCAYFPTIAQGNWNTFGLPPAAMPKRSAWPECLSQTRSAYLCAVGVKASKAPCRVDVVDPLMDASASAGKSALEYPPPLLEVGYPGAEISSETMGSVATTHLTSLCTRPA